MACKARHNYLDQQEHHHILSLPLKIKSLTRFDRIKNLNDVQEDVQATAESTLSQIVHDCNRLELIKRLTYDGNRSPNT